MRPLVVLRPQPGATATCEAAKAAGLEPLALPLFEVVAMPWEAPDGSAFDGLLLTSANALRHGGSKLEQLRGLPVYAVGEATAGAAREAGFTLAHVGGGGVDDLLAGADPGLRLLHLCGEQRREAIAPRQMITRLPIYRAVEIEAASVAPVEGAVVAVHSPRAGARLAELAARDDVEISRTAIVAISREAARAAGGGWESSVVAPEPADAALLALAVPLCNNSAQR